MVDPTKENVPFDLLKNENLPLEVLPLTYDLKAYHNAILHPKGLTRTDVVSKFYCCETCYRALIGRRSLPPLALANWMYYAHDRLPPGVDTAFAAASPFDKLLVARGRTTRIIYKFSQGTLAQPMSQGYNRGNVVVLPQDTSTFNDILPATPAEISKAVCALFVGREPPTWDTLRALSPVLISKRNVNTMLHFLIQKNPAYRSVRYSQERLDSLVAPIDGGHEDDPDLGVPSHGITIEHLLHTNRDQPVDVTSGYAERHGSPLEEQPNGDLLMESVGYIEGDHSRASTLDMKLQALNWCKAGKQYLHVSSGSVPMMDRDPYLLTWLFPHLDPFGIGGFLHPQRSPVVSMARQLEHLLKMTDSPFAQDPSFAFVFYNIIQKANVNRNTQFVVKSSARDQIVSDITTVSPDAIRALQLRLEKNPRAELRSDEERKVMTILRRLHVIGKSLPGGGGVKLKMRNEIRALMGGYGLPSFFVTINPADTYHPIVRLLAGNMAYPDELTRGDELSSVQRMLLVARNPLAGAMFFDIMIRQFINNILRYKREDGGFGLYGKCIAYYGTVETTGRGTLHCHMLIWLQGALSPTDLRHRLQTDPAFKSRMFEYLEACIYSHLPGVTTVESADPALVIKPTRPPGEKDPRLLSPPSAQLIGTAAFKEQFNERVSKLAIACNWHQHTHTCWKNLKANQTQTDANCRLRMTGMTRAKTTIDDATGSILLRRLHPWLANYNPVVMFTMDCNNEGKFIGSGPEALATAYYITNYVTKYGVPAHVGLSALLQAIRKRSSVPDEPVSEEKASKQFLTRAVNAIMGRQEVSHQQIMHYLTGGKDYYTSHVFTVLHWSNFKKVLRRVYPIPEVDVPGEGNTTSSIDLADELDVSHIFEAFAPNGDSLPPDANAQPNSESDFLITLQQNDATICSQVDDYRFRSDDPPFRDISLYEMVSATQKETIKKDHDRLAEPSIKRPRKTPKHRGQFMDGHPQAKTHHLRLRALATVPVILGPRLARPDRSCDECERWCLEMMSLFKPWRNIDDLKENHATWFEAMDNFVFTPEQERIMACIHSVNECRDARDQYELTQENTKVDDIGLVHVHQAAGEVGGSIADLTHSEMTDMIVSAAASWEQAQQVLDDDLRVNSLVDQPSIGSLFSGCHMDWEKVGSAVDVGTAENVSGWESHRTAMATLRKIRRPQTIPIVQTNKRFTHQPRDPRTSIEILRDAIVEPTSSSARIALEVMEGHGLTANAEQMMAYRMIADHIVQRKSDQLLMYVSGVGGTGKSHIIQAIVDLFQRLREPEALLLTAYTGIAATLIGGYTCHSLLFLSDVLKTEHVNVEELQRLWRLIRYLILDEMSLISASFLYILSYRLCLAKSSVLPFGGVHIIFMGDFGQLRPVARHCLFSHELLGGLQPSIVERRETQDALHGLHLWRQVTRVVELKTNMRSITDTAYGNLTARVRRGIAWQGHKAHTIEQAGNGSNYSETDYDILRHRLASTVLLSDPANFNEFRDAPFIVPLKADRDALNVFVARSIASDHGMTLNFYMAVDRTRQDRLTGKSQQNAWNLRSTITKDSLGRLPLMPGMRAMITENLAVSRRLVNGTEVIVRDILYRTDISGHRYAVCVFVDAPGVKVDLPGLNDGIVPIYPQKTRFSGAEIGMGNAQITREQIPLIPAYAYTDFKSQGRTLTRAIVDLSTSRSLQSVYVMLSRVKTLRGLLILRDFPANKVNGRLSEEFRNEFTRLSRLAVDTETAWRRDHDTSFIH